MLISPVEGQTRPHNLQNSQCTNLQELPNLELAFEDSKYSRRSPEKVYELPFSCCREQSSIKSEVFCQWRHDLAVCFKINIITTFSMERCRFHFSRRRYEGGFILLHHRDGLFFCA